MSRENVEIVREVMALVRRAGKGAPDPRLFELFLPEIKLDFSRRRVDPDVYEGHAGLLRFQQERDAVWEEFLVTPEQLLDAGDAVVVIESLPSSWEGQRRRDNCPLHVCLDRPRRQDRPSGLVLRSPGSPQSRRARGVAARKRNRGPSDSALAPTAPIKAAAKA